MESVRALHNDVDLHLLLADTVDGYLNINNDIFETIEAEHLGIDSFVDMSFKYDMMEFCTAVKPFALQYLINKGYEKVIYFDPDIMVFNKLDIIFDLLEKYSIVLTPHITNPISIHDTKLPAERDFLRAGTYNLGFIAISSTEISKTFLDWWSDRCKYECFNEPENGYFVDQKWLNLVSGIFKSVYILRHSGCNMSYWNLHERRLNNLVVNKDYDLVFYHFSGINISDLNIISKYQNRYTLDTRPDLREIFSLYKERVLSNGYEETITLRYKYGYFDNGRKIGPLARRLYASCYNKFTNPFSVDECSYLELLRRHHLLDNESEKQLTADGIRRKAKVLEWFLKLLAYLIGADKYYLLMKYLRHVSILRNQAFLLR